MADAGLLVERDAGEDSGQNAVTSDSGAAGDAGASTVAFSATLFDHGMPSQPLPGVRYTVLDHPEIAEVETGADGRVTLAGLPPETEIVLIEEQDGQPPFAYFFTTGSEDIDIGLRVRLPNGFDAIQAAQAGVAIDETKGQVRVGVSQPGTVVTTPDATLSLSPASGEGPIYAGSDNVYDPDLTATTTSGAPSIFFNVDPGEVEVTVGPETLRCTSDLPQSPTWKSGWAASAPNSVRLRSIAGHLGSVRIYCE